MGCCKKRCLVRLSIVTMVLTLVGYQIASFVNAWDRRIYLRALEFAYRDLEDSTEGIRDYKPDWKEVMGGEGRVFMYSAFLDHRLAVIPQVRILVLAPLKGMPFVECSFWTLSNQSTTVIGVFTIFTENHDLPLSTGAIDCPLPGFPYTTVTGDESPLNVIESDVSQETMVMASDKSLSRAVETINSQYRSFDDREKWIHPHGEKIQKFRPDPVVRVAVSVVAGASENYSASIPVEVLVNRRKRGELNICVKQMHSNYNSASWLVEFIELQRILGADHFTFYNLSIGPDVDRVLQHYIEEGVAQVMPFSAPDPSNSDNIDRVQLASLNDCILRSVGRYPLVAVIDVDEIIVPRKADDNLMMVQELGHFAEYCVQNAWFYLFYVDDNDRDDGSKTNKEVGENVNFLSTEGDAEMIFVTQRKTKRAAELNRHKIRSKYFCRPEEVQLAGIHSVHTFFGGGSAIWVGADTALSHHYRASCEEDDRSICYKKPTVVDRTAHRFKNPLANAVIRACQSIFPDRRICLPLS